VSLPRPTRPSIPLRSVNEDQLLLRKQRQVRFIPSVDKRVSPDDGKRVNQLGGLGSAVSSPAGSGEAPVENEFGALWSCQKPTGGDNFESSEVHVSQ